MDVRFFNAAGAALSVARRSVRELALDEQDLPASTNTGSKDVPSLLCQVPPVQDLGLIYKQESRNRIGSTKEAQLLDPVSRTTLSRCPRLQRPCNVCTRNPTAQCDQVSATSQHELEHIIAATFIS